MTEIQWLKCKMAVHAAAQTAIMQQFIPETGAGGKLPFWIGSAPSYLAISFAASSFSCSRSCRDITSIHQAS